MAAIRTQAEHEPIARVLPLLTVPHLDREFDYLVSTEQSDDAQPGVRVRVRLLRLGLSGGALAASGAAASLITPRCSLISAVSLLICLCGSAME